MNKTPRKHLTPLRRVKEGIENEQLNRLPTQKITEYMGSLQQYFNQYKKMNNSIANIGKNLNSMHVELESLSQFTLTKATHTIINDLNKRWEANFSQIKTTLGNFGNSDRLSLIATQFGKLQSAIDKVSQSPPTTPKAQKESNELYSMLQSQIDQSMDLVNLDFQKAKESVQLLRDDMVHRYEQFFKLSQINKNWKRTVCDECRTCLDKILCYLDFPNGTDIQLPIDPNEISKEFKELLSLNYASSKPKKVRSVSVASRCEIHSIQQQKQEQQQQMIQQQTPINQRKSCTQIPKPVRSKSAQNENKNKPLIPTRKSMSNTNNEIKTKNSEMSNSENVMKNIIEDLQLIPREHSPICSPSFSDKSDSETPVSNNKQYEKTPSRPSFSSTMITQSKSSSNSNPSDPLPKNKKSRLPKRAISETPQPIAKQTFRSSLSKLPTKHRNNAVTTPEKNNQKQQISEDKIVTPSQVSNLLNSPQICSDDEVDNYNDDEVTTLPAFSGMMLQENMIPRKFSPKVEKTQFFKTYSPTHAGSNNIPQHTNYLYEQNEDNITSNFNNIKNSTKSLKNDFKLEELLNNSDSDEIINAVENESVKSPTLGKLRQDLASITQTQIPENLDFNSIGNALESFITKFEDHLPLIQTNRLLDSLFTISKKAYNYVKHSQQHHAMNEINKIQNIISLVEEELIDSLSLDHIDSKILEIGKSIKKLADAFFKEDPTHPIIDQFSSISTRLNDITGGNVNHYLSSEVQKLHSMKPQIKEYVETKQQLLKTQSTERKKIVNEMNFVQQRMVYLQNCKLKGEPVDEDIEGEISDLMSQQLMLIQKLSTLVE
ncbi:hypothetical protein TRFO_08679 [Tritrichomonas foetus]|uniref:Uncharacterized protein n=1 Tax=Tritrichomonas foetus TaxID=1144522 RepID=A0A1J4JK11_9EUKA|nr:hypothetical protein TRFO_08679 [Tritrichomonas foetus]|eukprot:OHS98703.1 hypothetical protein TRFO_08679 [Tritrichomonas foetus]